MISVSNPSLDMADKERIKTHAAEPPRAPTAPYSAVLCEILDI